MYSGIFNSKYACTACQHSNCRNRARNGNLWRHLDSAVMTGSGLERCIELQRGTCLRAALVNGRYL